MAKPLVFLWGEDEISLTPVKVDRSKLYGYKEVEVLDEAGEACDLATLADDGKTLVGRGGTGLGYVDADGLWCEKSNLQAVDLDGNPIEPAPSSFLAPIKLFETATVDDYLSHNMRLVYQLESEEPVDELAAELSKGTIFAFPYSFRGGLEADAGFMLQGVDGNLFLVVGDRTRTEFLGIQQSIAVDDEEGADETDFMDFDMI